MASKNFAVLLTLLLFFIFMPVSTNLSQFAMLCLTDERSMRNEKGLFGVTNPATCIFLIDDSHLAMPNDFKFKVMKIAPLSSKEDAFSLASSGKSERFGRQTGMSPILPEYGTLFLL